MSTCPAPGRLIYREKRVESGYRVHLHVAGLEPIEVERTTRRAASTEAFDRAAEQAVARGVDLTTVTYEAVEYLPEEVLS